MTAPYIHIRRIPYEEPYHLNLEFQASNGIFSGGTDLYCNANDLLDISQSLKAFPNNPADEFVYEYGENHPDDKMYRYFRLRFYTIDHSGHCAVQFTADTRTEEPDEGTCNFSFRVEPAAINRLARLMETFHELRHLELRWSPTGGALYEDYQSDLKLID